MSIRGSKLITAFAIVLLLALCVWWRVQQQQLQAVRGEIEILKARLTQVERATAATKKTATRTAVADPTAAPEHFPNDLLSEPARFRALERANLDRKYAGLFRHLGLRPDELSSLQELLLDRIERVWKVNGFAHRIFGQGLGEWVNETDELEYARTGTPDIDARIRQLLGEARYAYYAQYEGTLPWRDVFKDLAVQLRPTEPLTDEQIDQLTTWAAETGPNLNVLADRSGPKIPSAVVERAEALLTRTQWEKLVQLKAATDAYAQMMRYAQQKAAEHTP